MKRRGFVTACAFGMGCMSLAPHALLASGEGRKRTYDRVRLVDFRGRPVRPAALDAERNYVFHYPYRATPCFLLDLGEPLEPHNGLQTEEGETYDWPGGVGPGRSVVAYSAICAHKMAHPTQQVSYIGFRAPGTGGEAAGRIKCCAENSAYDPYRGAEVQSGPARQPLAAILLEHDETEDALYATGTLGGALFQRFFDEFQARLNVEYPDGSADQRVRDEAEVVPLEQFSGNVMRC